MARTSPVKEEHLLMARRRGRRFGGGLGPRAPNAIARTPSWREACSRCKTLVVLMLSDAAGEVKAVDILPLHRHGDVIDHLHQDVTMPQAIHL